MRDERRREVLAGRYRLASSTCFACSRLQRRNSTIEDGRGSPPEGPLLSVSGMSMMMSLGIMSALPEGRGGGTCRPPEGPPLFIGVFSMIMSRGIIVNATYFALASLADSNVVACITSTDLVGTRMPVPGRPTPRRHPEAARMNFVFRSRNSNKNCRRNSQVPPP